jgi:hypothetical protein
MTLALLAIVAGALGALVARPLSRWLADWLVARWTEADEQEKRDGRR